MQVGRFKGLTKLRDVFAIETGRRRSAGDVGVFFVGSINVARNDAALNLDIGIDDARAATAAVETPVGFMRGKKSGR